MQTLKTNLNGGSGLVRLRFMHGTVREVAVVGSEGSSEGRVRNGETTNSKIAFF